MYYSFSDLSLSELERVGYRVLSKRRQTTIDIKEIVVIKKQSIFHYFPFNGHCLARLFKVSLL